MTLPNNNKKHWQTLSRYFFRKSDKKEDSNIQSDDEEDNAFKLT